jgi:hypothetical protein
MMTFDAHFDGEHLCPAQPVVLPMNVRLKVTVSQVAETPDRAEVVAEESKASEKGVFGALLDKHGLLDGPEDWSVELDHYLYGTPKRGENSES